MKQKTKKKRITEVPQQIDALYLFMSCIAVVLLMAGGMLGFVAMVFVATAFYFSWMLLYSWWMQKHYVLISD